MTLAYGKVVGRFLAAVTDGPDEGDEPDLVPLSGTITFDLNVKKLIDLDGPVVVAKTPFTAVLDANGYLCTPASGGGAGVQGLTVIATDSAVNPTNLQYRVSYALKAGTTSVSLDAHQIVVPAGATVELSALLTPEVAPPIGVPAAEYAAARAEAAAATVQAAIDAAAGMDQVREDAEAARDETVTAASDAAEARDGAITAQTAAEAAQAAAEAAVSPEAIAIVVQDYLDEHPVTGGGGLAVVVEVDGAYPTPDEGYSAYRYVGPDDPDEQDLPVPDGSEWLEVV